ncbi:MAG: type II toxin-antitoxin system RelE/ParE family toxin [Thermosynechococcaceae cyanobacterium MS004]|nr:type II toxin-antitoxin system RelE/ParE family toxin [Thermosynechococcaceae cyanobacterium MS004]
MNSWVVREYLTQAGENPYRNWLACLDKAVKARVQARVMRFEQGNLGDSKVVGEGVWEARLMFGAGYRIYFALDGDTILLLLLGGDKRTQSKDIRKAQQYWTDYCTRRNNG